MFQFAGTHAILEHQSRDATSLEKKYANNANMIAIGPNFHC